MNAPACACRHLLEPAQLFEPSLLWIQLRFPFEDLRSIGHTLILPTRDQIRFQVMLATNLGGTLTCADDFQYYRVPHKRSRPADNLLNIKFEFQPTNPCKKLTY